MLFLRTILAGYAIFFFPANFLLRNDLIKLNILIVIFKCVNNDVNRIGR